MEVNKHNYKKGDRVSTTLAYKGKTKNGQIVDLYYNPTTTVFKKKGWILLVRFEGYTTGYRELYLSQIISKT